MGAFQLPASSGGRAPGRSRSVYPGDFGHLELGNPNTVSKILICLAPIRARSPVTSACAAPGIQSPYLRKSHIASMSPKVLTLFSSISPVVACLRVYLARALNRLISKPTKPAAQVPFAPTTRTGHVRQLLAMSVALHATAVPTR